MTQPGKFDPSFVDPTEKVSQQSDRPVVGPIVKKDDGTKQRFKNVLEKKLEEKSDSEDTSQEVATTNAPVAHSSTLFDLASTGKTKDFNSSSSHTVDTVDLLTETHIDLLTVDTKPSKPLTAIEMQQLAELKKQFPVIPEPHDMYQSVKNSDQPTTPIISGKIETKINTPIDDTTSAQMSGEMKEFSKGKEKVAFVAAVSDEIHPTATHAPIATPAVATTASVATNTSVPVRQEARVAMVELVDKLVSSLVIMSRVDRTDTQITLQHPPLFAGATVVITEFASSKQQFNLTFYNLSPDARALIANVQNQDNLRSTLIERGYTLQMVTLEAKSEPPTIITSQSKGTGQQGREQQKQSQQQDKDTVT